MVPAALELDSFRELLKLPYDVRRNEEYERVIDKMLSNPECLLQRQHGLDTLLVRICVHLMDYRPKVYGFGLLLLLFHNWEYLRTWADVVLYSPKNNNGTAFELFTAGTDDLNWFVREFLQPVHYNISNEPEIKFKVFQKLVLNGKMDRRLLNEGFMGDSKFVSFLLQTAADSNLKFEQLFSKCFKDQFRSLPDIMDHHFNVILSSQDLISAMLNLALDRDLRLLSACFAGNGDDFFCDKDVVQICQTYYLTLCSRLFDDPQESNTENAEHRMKLTGVVMDICILHFNSFQMVAYDREDTEICKVEDSSLRFAEKTRLFLLQFVSKVVEALAQWPEMFSQRTRDPLFTKIMCKLFLTPIEGVRAHAQSIIASSAVAKNLFDRLSFDQVFINASALLADCKLCCKNLRTSKWSRETLPLYPLIFEQLSKCFTSAEMFEFFDDDELNQIVDILDCLSNLVSKLKIHPDCDQTAGKECKDAVVGCLQNICRLVIQMSSASSPPQTLSTLANRAIQTLLRTLCYWRKIEEARSAMTRLSSIAVSFLPISFKYADKQTREMCQQILKMSSVPENIISKLRQVLLVSSSSSSSTTATVANFGNNGKRRVSEGDIWDQMRNASKLGQATKPLIANSSSSSDVQMSAMSRLRAVHKQEARIPAASSSKTIQPPSLPHNNNNRSISRSSSNNKRRRMGESSSSSSSDEDEKGVLGESIMDALIKDTPTQSTDISLNVSMQVRPREYAFHEQRRTVQLSESSQIPKHLTATGIGKGASGSTKQKAKWEQMQVVMRDCLERFYSELLTWDLWKICISSNSSSSRGSDQLPKFSVKNLYSNIKDYISTFEPLIFTECQAQISRDFELSQTQNQRLSMTLNSVSHVNGYSKAIFYCEYEDYSTSTSNSRKSFDLSDVDLLYVCFVGKQPSDTSIGSSAKYIDCFKSQVKDGTYCLGKVTQIQLVPRQPQCGIATVKIFTRTRPQLIQYLMNQTRWQGLKVTGLSTQEREFQSVHGLEFYPLAPYILDPSKKPPICEDDISACSKFGKSSLNEAQLSAIQNAQTIREGFLLIHGPPGTGKTTVIQQLIECTLSNNSTTAAGAASKSPHMLLINNYGGNGNSRVIKKSNEHILVCAPSNAAVDELVRRLSTTTVRNQKLKIVRVGTLEGVHASTRQFTIEELVESKLESDPEFIRLTKSVDATKGSVYQLRKQLEDIRRVIQKQYALLDSMAELVDEEKSAEIEQRLEQLQQQQNSLRGQLNDRLIGGEDHGTKKSLDRIRARVKYEIVNNADVILATLSMSAHDHLTNTDTFPNLLSTGFDMVIIDEACQSTEISCLIPLRFIAKVCVLVGDPNQLPPTVLSKMAQSKRYDQSLFVRIQKSAIKASDILLNVQYRMHPEISRFPNVEFYEGRLIDGSELMTSRRRPWHSIFPYRPYAVFDVYGQEEMSHRKSLSNDLEVKFIVATYKRLRSELVKSNAYSSSMLKGKVGILTPYKDQKRLLIKEFTREGLMIEDAIEINTVDGFQGQEKEIIIFSCVRGASRENGGTASGNIGFLADVRRMNVAITRAKCSLWVVGNSEKLRSNSVWRRLLEDAQQRNVLIDTHKLSYFNK